MFSTHLPPLFVLIIESTDYLEITPVRYHDWRVLAELHGYVIWNREGQVRVVKHDVLTNALNTFENYQFMVEAGRLVEAPKEAGRITWEQAVDVAHH